MVQAAAATPPVRIPAQTQGATASVVTTSNQTPAQPTATGKAATNSGGMQLDPARIAALQAESERVTVLLSKVFDEEVPVEPMAADSAEDAGPETLEAPRLLGLDGEHSAFLRLLKSQMSNTFNLCSAVCTIIRC